MRDWTGTMLEEARVGVHYIHPAQSPIHINSTWIHFMQNTYSSMNRPGALQAHLVSAYALRTIQLSNTAQTKIEQQF